jgi:hypothetical protein
MPSAAHYGPSDPAVPVVGVDAGPAGLHQAGPDAVQPGQVELTLGAEPSGGLGALRRQQPAGADDLAALGVADEQVVAVGVEGVGVVTGLRRGRQGARLAGEDLVPQPLGGPYAGLVAGESDGVAGGGGGSRGTVEGGNAGHGSPGHGAGSAELGSRPLAPGLPPLFFRCRPSFA